MTEAISDYGSWSMVKFSSKVFRMFMTINNKSERNDGGKCLGCMSLAQYGPV